MLSFPTVTPARHPPVHTPPARRIRVAPPCPTVGRRPSRGVGYAPVCPADGDFRPRLGPSEAVARRRIASVVHSFVVWRIRPDHGRILTICLKAMGLRAGPSPWGADRLRRSPIGVWSSESFAEVIDKLGIIDCGRFAAKSSDNYATWSGKRRLNPSL